MRKVKLYAHRGGSGLMPENTLPAYCTSLKLGVDLIDGDLALTRDRVFVISHDQRLNPHLTRYRNALGDWDYITPSQSVPIKTLTYDELRQNYEVGCLDPNSSYAKSFPAQRSLAGVFIPKLEEVIDLLKHPAYQQVGLNLEIKIDFDHLSDPSQSLTYPPLEIAETLIQQLADYEILDRVEIQCFYWPVLARIHHLNPKVKLGFLSIPNHWLSWFENEYQTPPISLNNYAQILLETIHKMTVSSFKNNCLWEPYCRYIHFKHPRTGHSRKVLALTKQMVELAHQNGIKVIAWTLYDPITLPPAYNPYESELSQSTKQTLLLGVDGILTNRVDIARGIMAAEGYELPLVPT